MIKLNYYFCIFLEVMKENEKTMRKQHDCDDNCGDTIEVVNTKNKKRNRIINLIYNFQEGVKLQK